MLSGANIYFWTPPTDAVIKAEIAKFKAAGWGCVSIRTLWAVLEPSKGNYSTQCLRALRTYAAECKKANIILLIDLAHTITPTSSWSNPSNVGSQTRNLAVLDGNNNYQYPDLVTQYHAMQKYYVENLKGYGVHAYAVWNEAGRVESVSGMNGVLGGWAKLAEDSKRILEAVDNTAIFCVRFSLPDSPFKTGTPKYDTDFVKKFKACGYNEYLDARNENDTAWACNWDSVREAVAFAHQNGLHMWVTEWGGTESGPNHAVDFYRAHLVKLTEIGVDMSFAYNYVSEGQGDDSGWSIRDSPELIDIVGEYNSEGGEPPMATVAFSGKLSAQAKTQTGTISITQPNGSKEDVPVTTNTTGNFTATKQYSAVGDYSASVSFGSDGEYKACSSPNVVFSISAELKDRTVTLVVNVE